ncbi:uncharacterized protein LOC100574057 isoform X1 [Acyrthosiphon pisum]|uniref:Uncharacterized protein n=1 Tax=Acyrthosiphon pisum TaxID=7029 RepID=A0A8R2NR32_ACYPI|nr:uncharacterized protein LOC100574057 isoform X1 [Acyrthosiphon pisum]XP_029345478.1 uncharacterized protein LOC100574057 isoform X1 [Acyrthosiphon pisum]XP_029345479.1 uncharacterized protein LOC100574057 isoform X1 [Acyrthosiphon pisum]XP_029345480.1 uncharacterized protein LOC100574057 isoform X1 [Acyrthosiphon pisum]|eukprot:XP_008179417.1 PREDICTED: uncharacterized protein LOC100574057 isoform X1 [Acyrthosiphon pisum]
MVDTNRDNNNAVVGKGILKRRIFVRNDRPPQQSTTAVTKPLQDGGCCLVNVCKRCVTFDETITIKTDKDLVVKKPLKLELVIDNWKSYGTKTPTETIQSDPGIVRRLVDEFNTIEEKAITAKLTNGKSSLHGRSQSTGRVTDLINMFNSKSTNGKIEELEMKFVEF